VSSAYVYGVVAADAPAVTAPGLEDAPVRQVRSGAVAALVSDVDGELLGRRAELLRHAEVVGAALEHGPVLPLTFGTVLAGDDAVVTALLAPREATLTTLLEEIGTRVEVRVRGYYEEERVLAEIVAERPQLRRSGQSLDERIKLGEAVVAEVARRRAVDAADIVERLRPLAADVVGEEPSSAMMVLNVAFLLDRAELERFDDAVAEVGRALAPRVQLKYVGPFPPASFVDLDVGG
jgi:hypothetical protein